MIDSLVQQRKAIVKHERRQSFNITGIVSHELGDKLLYHYEPMYDDLTKIFNVKDYGNALDLICMICVAQPPFNSWRDNYIMYNEKKKEFV